MAFTLEYDAIQELELFHLKTYFQGISCRVVEVQFKHIEIESYDKG